MKKILILLVLWVGFAIPQTLVTINDEKIGVDEFKQFVNYQKYLYGVMGKSFSTDESVIRELLKQYVDNKIVLLEAQKKGYTEDKEEVKNLYETSKKDWLVQAFLATKLDMKGLEPKEEEIRQQFEQLKKNGMIPGGEKLQYKDLPEETKQMVAQRVSFEKVNALRSKYREELEKKYKVVRNAPGKDAVYLAVVEGTPITKAEVEERLEDEVKNWGGDFDELKKRKEYADYQKMVLDELILMALANKEIEATKFQNDSNIQYGLKWLSNQSIFQLFIRDEIYKNIKVSEKEKEDFYKENKDRLKSMSYSQMENYIEGAVRDNKAQYALRDFLDDKRDSYVIKRNMEELKKVKF